MICQHELVIILKPCSTSTFPFKVVAANSLASTVAFEDANIECVVVQASDCMTIKLLVGNAAGQNRHVRISGIPPGTCALEIFGLDQHWLA